MAAPDSSLTTVLRFLLDSSAGAALHAAAAALHKSCSNASCPESFCMSLLAHNDVLQCMPA